MGVIFLVMMTQIYIPLESSPRIHWVYMTWRVTQPIGSMIGMTLITIGVHLLIIREGQRQVPKKLGAALIFQS